MQILDETVINKILTYESLINHLEKCHQKPKYIIDDWLLKTEKDNGIQNEFRHRVAWEPNKWLGIKCVTDFPGNSLKQDQKPRTQGLFILFNGKCGTPEAIIDSLSLSYWKTACDSALASQFLSKRNASSLLMIGAGTLAEPLIKAHLSVRKNIRIIRIWNRTVNKAHALVKKLKSKGAKFIVTENLPKAASNSDIIVSATRSTSPIILGEWLRPGTHIDLVGAFTPDMREADDKTIKRGQIFVDCRETTIDKIGEIILPINNGTIKKEDICADLFELCNHIHQGRKENKAITIFKNGGGGHLDLMTASHIFEKFKSSIT